MSFTVIAYTILLGISGVSVSFSDAFCSTITVCAECDITEFGAAIDLASPHDSIILDGGLYTEGNIVVNKPLHIFGRNGATLDGQGQFELLTIRSDSVSVSGLIFQNIGANYIEDRAAIHVDRSDWVVIENNRLINTFFGIYLQKVDHCVVRGNYIEGNAEVEISSGNAIHAWNCNDLRIVNNKALNHRDGIYMEFVDSSYVANNLSMGNLRYGLHFMFSNNNTYASNRFETNGAGVAVMFSKHITMRDNDFQNNWGTASYGLLLKEITDSRISGNRFTSNTTGIYAESSNRLEVTQNDFRLNGWALKILGSCRDDIFSQNNFIGNTFDLTTNSSGNLNRYNGNYWSSYKGYDLDKDGIGDIPHRPVSLFAHVVGQVPTSIVLLRSLFVDLINFAESVTPIFTPTSLADHSPQMNIIVP